MALSESTKILIQKGIREQTGLEVNVSCSEETGDIVLTRLVKVVRKPVGVNQIDLFTARESKSKAKIGDYIELPLEENAMISHIIDESLAMSTIAEETARRKKEATEELKTEGIIEYSLIFPVFTGETLLGDANFKLNNKYEVRLTADRKLPTDKFEVGREYPMIILAFEDRQGEIVIQASRTTAGLVEELLRVSLVNCTSNVDIVKIQREPGKLTKVIVATDHPYLNASGVVVGPKGSRIKSVESYLGPEKIEVVDYAINTPKQLLEILGKNNIVNIYFYFEELEEFKAMRSVNKKKLLAVVKDSYVSKVIGKGGVALSLSNKLSGWVIQVMSESDFNAKHPNGCQPTEALFDWLGVEETLTDTEYRYFSHYLNEAGVSSLAECYDWQKDALDSITDLTADDKSFFFDLLSNLEFETTCPNCGSTVSTSDHVCPNCGVKLTLE